MSIFTIISLSAFQQVTRPYEQPQDPFLVIQAQQTDQVLLKNRETRISLENSTAQNQSELQVLSTTRDNINGKQTVPAVVRPKTKINEPRVDSGELDINVQSLNEQVCQIQTHNVQQTAMKTENIHIYQSRPLTHVADVPENEEPITPNLFCRDLTIHCHQETFHQSRQHPSSRGKLRRSL